jgi:hypothetical protein
MEYTVPIVFTTVAPWEVLPEDWQRVALCCKTPNGGPLGGAARGPGSDHHLDAENIGGGPPGGAASGSSNIHYLVVEEASMVVPLGVLPVGLAVTTT